MNHTPTPTHYFNCDQCGERAWPTLPTILDDLSRLGFDLSIAARRCNQCLIQLINDAKALGVEMEPQWRDQYFSAATTSDAYSITPPRRY